MRRGGGKQKGAQFERDVCRQLSLWVSDGKQEDVFWRSAMSGGRSTVAAAKGKRLAAQAGDISCIHPCGAAFAERFYVECKFYKSLDFVGLLKGTGKLVEFWDETWNQAAAYGKLPLLVARQNRLPEMACLCLAGVDTLHIGRLLLAAPRIDLRIIPWSEFLKKAVKPDGSGTTS